MNLTVFRGDDKTLTGEVQDQDGAAVNISGWTIVFSAAQAPGETPLVSVEAAITDAAAGTFTVALSRTHTSTVQRMAFDVQATTSDSKVHTLASGILSIIQDVTI